MKKLLLAFALFAHVFAFSSNHNTRAAAWVDPFEEILEIFGISSNLSFAQIAEEATVLWMQKDRERWEFDHRFEYMKPQLWPLFEQMGLLQEVKPKSTHYDYVLICGALVTSMEESVAYLAKLKREGLQFDQIIFLTSRRPLTDPEVALTHMATEKDAAEWLFGHSQDLNDSPAFFANAPMKEKDGLLVRPDRANTIGNWLQSVPKPGKCLALCIQPYVEYQNVVISSYLPENFSLEMAGPAVKNDPSVALILDTIARELSWRHPS